MQSPRDDGQVRGTFSLRSPMRPNPIATQIVALERIDSDVTVQGNLDPALLGAPWEIIEAGIDHVMLAGSVARAHVFNLGHGVPPSTDPAVLTRIVEAVHAR